MKNEILTSLTTYKESLVASIENHENELTIARVELSRTEKAIEALAPDREFSAVAQEEETVEAKNPTTVEEQPQVGTKPSAKKTPAKKASGRKPSAAKEEPKTPIKGRKIDYSRNDGELVQAVVLEALEAGAKTTTEIINFAKNKKQKVTTFKIQKVAEKNPNVLAERKGNKMIYSLA